MRPDLRALLAFWQAELRLRDWQITAEYVKNLCAPPSGAATGGGGAAVYGLCYPLADNMTALIQIRDPLASDDGVVFTPTMVEAKLVHEVYHCMLADAGIDPIREERITWATSEALVRLKDSPAGALLRRAVAARARAALVGRVAKQASSPRRAGARRTSMDPMKVFLIALKALLTAPDPKAGIEALISEMESAGLGGGYDAGPVDAGGDAPPGDMPPAAGCGPDGKPMPARVIEQIRQRRAAAPLERGDVLSILAEERTKTQTIAAARAARVGVTDKLAAHLETRSLAEVRATVEALELRPADGATVARAAIAVGVGALEPGEAQRPASGDGLSDHERRYLDGAFPHTPKLAAPARAAQAGAIVDAPAREPGAWSVAQIREQQRIAEDDRRKRIEAGRGAR